MDKIFVVGIDKAIFLGQVTLGGQVCLHENSEYRTLAFIPVRIGKGGKKLLPAVSKDRIQWKLCVGAVINGKELDLNEMAFRAEIGCYDIVFNEADKTKADRGENNVSDNTNDSGSLADSHDDSDNVLGGSRN